MTDAAFAEPIVDDASKRRLQILLGVLLVAVLVYAVPKILFRDSGSSDLQVVPAQTPVTEPLVEDPVPSTATPPSFATDDDSELLGDVPFRPRDGKNPFEPRTPAVSRPTNPGTAGIVPPAPVLPPVVVPPAPAPAPGTAPPAPGQVLPAPTPIFGGPVEPLPEG